jgi:hypothetical protein
MKLFEERTINDFLQSNDYNLIQYLKNNKNIESNNADQLTTILIDKYKIKLLSIDMQNLKSEVKWLPENIPCNPYCTTTQKMVKIVANYSIPYSGNNALFIIKLTNQNKLNTSDEYQIKIDNEFVHFTIKKDFVDTYYIKQYENEINTQVKLFIDWIQSNLDELTKECTTYNDNLRNKIKLEIDRRIDEPKKRNQLSNDLNSFK